MTTRRATGELPEDGIRRLSMEDIAAVDDIEYRDVDVPEWGGVVRLRSLTGAERDAYDAESFEADRSKQGGMLKEFRLRRLARAMVGPDGAPMFKTVSEGVRFLGPRNGRVIDRLDDVVDELSGMSPAGVRRAAADLKVVPSDASGSASPESSGTGA